MVKIKKRRPFKYTGEFYRKVKNDLRAHEKNVFRNGKNSVTPNPSETHKEYCCPQSQQLDPPNTAAPNATEAVPETPCNSFEYYANKNTTDDIENKSFESSEKKAAIFKELQIWAIENKITRSAADGLLKILNTYNVVGMDFPKDSRVLISTPKTVNIVPMGVGEFLYIGIEKCLRQTFKELNHSLTLSLLFNMDGLPIFKSSRSEFWPILCAIENMSHIKPMTVCIYNGEVKPNIQDYLRPFVNEVKLLLDNGIQINGHKLNVSIKGFICDSPARCLMKGTAYFNSYHGCLKCTAIGEYDKDERHMSFPRTNIALRTDEDFRNQTDSYHHRETTPLTELPIDLVQDFPIADSLHLLDLGVMKRCLLGWTKGTFKKEFKWSASDISNLNTLLKSFNENMPYEIHRAVRALDCLSHWKALEFRTFLLYLGPIILKDFLPVHAYKHFLMLFCAVTICSSAAYLKAINIADNLFRDYIENYILLYGRDKISINIHNLCHIADDVKRFGELPKISAYQFENMLYILKNLVRSGNKPLAQIAKRLCEISQLPLNENCDNFPHVKEEKKNVVHSLPTCNKVFGRLYLNSGMTLADNKKNKWFMTTSNEIVGMINATYCNGALVIYGESIINKNLFFTEPFNSSYINIYSSLNVKFSPPKLYSLQEIKLKLLCLPYLKELVFVPLLHTV